MNHSEQDIVIAGGGMAAIRTAQALRDLDYPGRIVLLSEESCLPYDRPPLSKNFLLGKADEDNIRLLSAEKIAELQIDVRLSSAVTGIDRTARQVRLAGGDVVAYGRLVIATGARPIRLAWMPAYPNVHVLRDSADALRLRAALLPGQRIGIVGAGFIGLEIASVAIGMGCTVTMLESAATPLAAILGEELGKGIQRRHERHGVAFRCGVMVTGAEGGERVSSLTLSDGSAAQVDAVVVGVGQTPNVEWLSDSGLELHRGLVCDDAGRTSDPRIFGVGDAVCRRIGQHYYPTRHWTAASEQAGRVAKTISSLEQELLIEDHYFWSDQYGARLQFAGTVPHNPRLIWLGGSADEDKFLVLYCTADEVTAVLGLGSARDFALNSLPLRQGQRMAVPTR
jgi:3-phenylpropionate/trans-cinnamate dioxygenase ferredoxin reductase subunit